MANLYELSTAFGRRRVFHQQLPPEHDNDIKLEGDSVEHEFPDLSEPSPPIERYQVPALPKRWPLLATPPNVTPPKRSPHLANPLSIAPRKRWPPPASPPEIAPSKESPYIAILPSIEPLTDALRNLSVAAKPPLKTPEETFEVYYFLSQIKHTPVFAPHHLKQWETRFCQSRASWLKEASMLDLADDTPSTFPTNGPPPRKRSLPRIDWNYQPPRHSFLSLPGEIRNVIYEKCLVRSYLPFVSVPRQKIQNGDMVPRGRVYPIFPEAEATLNKDSDEWRPTPPSGCEAESQVERTPMLNSNPPYVLAYKRRSPGIPHRKGSDALIPQVLYLNRQIYQEAIPFLYNRDTFGFDSITMPCEWSDYARSKLHILYRQGRKTYALAADQWETSPALSTFLRNLSFDASKHIDHLYLHFGVDFTTRADLCKLISNTLRLKRLTLEFSKMLSPLGLGVFQYCRSRVEGLRELTVVCPDNDYIEKYIDRLATHLVENYQGGISRQRHSNTDMHFKIWNVPETLWKIHRNIHRQVWRGPTKVRIGLGSQLEIPRQRL